MRYHYVTAKTASLSYAMIINALSVKSVDLPEALLPRLRLLQTEWETLAE